MGITVGDVYTKFPNFKPSDMENLVGSKNFNGRTTISLQRIADYKGSYAQDLSVFVAGKEKNNYTKLLDGKQKTEINQQLGIVDNSNSSKNQNNTNPSEIPMNVSIFDIQPKEQA